MYNGNKVTRVEWTFKNVTIAESFRDWAVICEQAGDGSIIVIAPLKENGWTLNVDSSAADATTQRASPIAAFNPAMGIDPVDSPVLSGPLANQLGAPVKAYGPNEVSPVPGF